MYEATVDIQIEAIVRGVDALFSDLSVRRPHLHVMPDENGRPGIDVEGSFVVYRNAEGFLVLHPMSWDEEAHPELDDNDPEIADKVDALWARMAPEFEGMWPQMTTADWICIISTMYAIRLPRDEFDAVCAKAMASVSADSVLNKFYPG